MPDELSIRSILDSLSIIQGRILPPFMGSSWTAILFQLYTILCLGSYSIYKIIKGRSAAVIVLSKQRLVMSTLLISAIYLGCHQLLTLFEPVNYGHWGKIGFLFGSFFIIGLIPFHSANAVTLWMNKIGGGPYIVQSQEKGALEDERGEDFWACGPNFVRRTLAIYYVQGLYIPLIIFSLSSGYAQLVFVILWAFSFIVMLLLRIHSFGGPVLFGYFWLLYFAAYHAN